MRSGLVGAGEATAFCGEAQRIGLIQRPLDGS